MLWSFFLDALVFLFFIVVVYYFVSRKIAGSKWLEMKLWNNGCCYNCGMEYTFVRAAEINGRRVEFHQCRGCETSVTLKHLVLDINFDNALQKMSEIKDLKDQDALEEHIFEIMGDKAHNEESSQENSVLGQKRKLPRPSSKSTKHRPRR